MSPINRPAVLLFLWALVLSASEVWAQNEGQQDLDLATEKKLNATSHSELGEVIDLCESALKKGLDEGNTAFAQQLLSSTRLQRGMGAARRAVEAFARRDPDWSEFRKFALADLDRSVELEPNQPEALILIAQLNLLPGGETARARAVLDEAIAASSDDPAQKTKALMIRAGLADNVERRLADLNEAVRLSPDEITALRTRGLTLADMRKYDEALADFDKVLELDPGHLATLAAKIEVLTRQERYDDALALLEKLRGLMPQSVDPWVLQARVHGFQKDFEAAAEDLNSALKIDSDNLGVLLLRASVFQELKQTDKALADVEQVLKMAPDSTAAMRLRSAILAGAGKFEEAIKQFEELQKKAPEDLEVNLRLALIYSGEKKLEKAVELFSKVLASEPTNVIALRGRADTLLILGRHSEAIADFEKALKQEPNDDGLLNNLAWVLATSPDDALRNGKRAIELATKACELTEYKQAHILSTLGAAHAETGDFETAIKWSEKAVELGEGAQKEALMKELESYRAGKPWRELLTGEDPDTMPASPPPADQQESSPPAEDQKEDPKEPSPAAEDPKESSPPAAEPQP